MAEMSESQINTPPYPGTTRIEDGKAFDVAGKVLGSVDDSGQATSDAAQAAPTQPASIDYDALAKQTGSVGSETTSTPTPAADNRGFFERAAASFNSLLTGSETLPELYQKAHEFATSRGSEGTQGTRYEGVAKVGELAINLAKGAWAAQKHEAQTGLEQMKREGWIDKGEGAVRYLQGGIPLVGPVFGMVEDYLRQGKYAEASGAIATLLLPKLMEHFGPTVATHVDNVLNGSKNAQIALDARSTEAKVATDQAEAAVKMAQQARDEHATGKITNDQRVQAEETASEALKNSARAQKAVEEAKLAKANAGISLDK